MEEELRQTKREIGQLILGNERLLQPNKELEKQVAILKNYAEKDSVPIGYEECLDVQPFVVKITEDAQKRPTVQIVDKDKEKVEQGGNDKNNKDDVFVSSLCNRVKVEKRRKTTMKPKLDRETKVIIQPKKKKIL